MIVHIYKYIYYIHIIYFILHYIYYIYQQGFPYSGIGGNPPLAKNLLIHLAPGTNFSDTKH